jgi:hypothetical protein
MTIEFICSKNNMSGTRVVLWRKGNYLYQVESGSGLNKESKLIECEYYDAVRYFEKIAGLADWEIREFLG